MQRDMKKWKIIFHPGPGMTFRVIVGVVQVYC